MTWPDGIPGRALAAAYLLAVPATYTGVIWLLIGQLSGSADFAFGVPTVLFLAGALTIAALSFVLKNRVPEQTTRVSKRMTSDQRAYHRLALGLELPGAWRTVRG